MSDSLPDPPELLAPAGDWDALRAAVANGANAVYFGLSNFNARHRATNFTLEELPEVLAYLHWRNVRGYVAFNTLIFSDELAETERLVAAIAEAGTDAVIVQDLGLVRLIRRVAPGLPIHGSTQMTLTEPRGIEFVRQLGVERVIVARELSIEDIGRIVERTQMPLEVFVHGALCVAYSGQCLTSEALGGRSANRGQCAQACRLPYELVVDGKLRDTGDRQYLLSPQDLAAYDLIEPMVKLGVISFKIEGRLKSAEYVAITSQTYRAAINAAVAQRQFAIDKQQQLDLQQSFSRGFSHGFLDGVNHQVLVPARFPKSRGVKIGTVADKSPRGMIVELAGEHDAEIVKPGDGLVFDEGHPEQDEQGGRVVEVRILHIGLGNGGASGRSREIEVVFYPGSVNLAAVSNGALVWKTDDPRMRRRLEQSYARDVVPNRDAIHFFIRGTIGGAVELDVRDAAAIVGNSRWAGPLQVAQKHPITLELLREQLGRLGDTPFELGDVVSSLPADAMVPKSVLNDLRRRAVDELLERRKQVEQRIARKHSLERLQREVRDFGYSKDGSVRPKLTVLCRTMEQLDATLAWRPPDSSFHPAMVYCDFEDVRRYHTAVEKARAAGALIGLATLRIIKPHEEGLLRQIAKAAPDAALIRNLAGLVYFQEHVPQCQLIGDFSLNITNELTADLFRREKLARLTPGYDLNWDQLKAMLGRIDPSLFEVVVHQHMPMFHMEHCVFAAMLSSGKDYRDCGRPCDHHRVELRDRVGAAFPLLADTGCRNTVFNSVAQSAAEYIPQMQKLGVRHFRVELTRENAAQVGPLLERYAKVIAGLELPQQAWRNLQVLNQLGVTRGTLQQA
ncbi:MAG: U32 family peptidase [Pirellulales bacterium]|nr:U32 family peptidase [Pirellulales bacterium]